LQQPRVERRQARGVVGGAGRLGRAHRRHGAVRPRPRSRVRDDLPGLGRLRRARGRSRRPARRAGPRAAQRHRRPAPGGAEHRLQEALTGRRAAMAQDLRGYLDLIKRQRPDELVIVSKEVDPAYEITALIVKLEREARRRPVVIFERVRGSRFPVITNLHASRSRLAAAMRSAPHEMLRTYLRAMERPVPRRVVSAGPVKDVVLTGDHLDLFDLPQIIHHEGDAGAYLTAAISFARDPGGETWNCAYNRLMVKGRDTTSIHLTLGKHLWEFQRIAEARGEALPVAFAIGVHP